jgi:hypothetical protein
MKIGTALIFGICTLLAATVWAEDEKAPAGKRPEGRPGARRPGGPGGPGGEAFREAMLKRFDKDGDGKLSDEERAAAMKERGAGGRPEGKGGRRPAAGRGPGGPGGFAELMKKFDKDGDGKLSDDEKAAAREAMPKGGRPGGKGGRRPGGEKKPE